MIFVAFFISILGIFKSRDYHTIFWVSQSSILFILLLSGEFGSHGVLFQFYILLYVFLSFLITLYVPDVTPLRVIAESCKYRLSVNRLILVGALSGAGSLILYIIGAGGVAGISRNWIEIATSRTSFELIVSNFSQLFYLFSVALLLSGYYLKKSIYALFSILVISLVFLALTRVKAYLLPFLFSILVIFINDNKGRPLKTLLYGVAFGFFVIILYLLTTFFRWVGNSEKWDYYHFVEVFNNVLDKGIERNLVDQTTRIFNYYVESEKLFGQTYLSIFNPIIRIIGQSIENPMHLYSNILYGESFEMRGSAHPTVYVDAFANFGVLGVLTGPFWLLVIYYTYKLCMSQRLIGVMMFIVSTAYAIPIICRGSVYYGTLYLIFSVSFMLIIHSIIKKFYIKRYSQKNA